MEEWVIGNGVATLVLLVVVLTLRTLAARYIRTTQKGWTSQQRLRGLGYIKTASIIIFLLGVVYLWGEAIHGLAVSVFAIAFAIVFSVKETCMNLNGAFLRLQGHAYDIGDRIAIRGMRGDVIDISMLSTTLMEIGDGKVSHELTGRKIVFPNSMLLIEQVINESFLGNYHMVDVKFPIALNHSWQKAYESLLEIAKEECAPYFEHAKQRIRSLEKSRSIELPSLEPKVNVSLIEPDQINLHLTIPCPVHLKERLLQAITVRFLNSLIINSLSHKG
jgi:small-conductance mechanosensitive channel